MRRFAAATLMLLMAAFSGCASPGGGGAPAQIPTPGTSTGQSSVLPSGWRWESYGGVQVGVPGDFGWGSGSQRLGQWCIAGKTERARPMVGRPGASTAVGCPAGTDGNPETLIKNTGVVVGFDRTTEAAGVAHEGDRTTVRLDGVLITVNAPEGLRRSIVETVHRVDVDSYGCPATHPIGGRPQHRPAKPVDVASLRDVSAVSVCKFKLPEDIYDAEPRLISSLRLDGPAAEKAIRQVAQAPLGGGPDSPEECLPRVSYGHDGIVLLIRSAAGPTEMVLRNSGCDHNGFDDGIAVRSLTAEAVAPFIAGPNQVLEASGSGKLFILQPRPTAR